MTEDLLERFTQIKETVWELPKTYRQMMRVPVRVVATRKLLQEMDDEAIEQAVNVSSLAGIAGYCWAMADAHPGYGFPIGGVAAFDKDTGVISPGGVGFDINCGMRLLTTPLSKENILPRIRELVDELFEAVPTGVGASGFLKVSKEEFKKVTVEGAHWAVEQDFGLEGDLRTTEEEGKFLGADPDAVSDRAIERGLTQLGTLGSGNHYLEIQKVDKIFDIERAKSFGIEGENQIVVMFHCGSRGFGHQIGTDYLRIFEKAMAKYGIRVPDMQLACAPFKSSEGQRYFAAMKAGANCALANRQIIAHRVRQVFQRVLGLDPKELKQVYDISHNTAKLEEFLPARHGGPAGRQVIVHRKGATRSFPNQPVIIGGSMETGSYLLIGTKSAQELTLGSTCHGAGRVMSRVKARKMIRGEVLQKEMAKRGIYVKSASFSGLSEEAGFAYKDIHQVVEAVDSAGISKKVASFVPVGNIKG